MHTVLKLDVLLVQTLLSPFRDTGSFQVADWSVGCILTTISKLTLLHQVSMEIYLDRKLTSCVIPEMKS